ncbi:type I restriction endonuclease subunit R [Pasteurella multocida]|uniref:type I restriction endonuclease subunit R n=1 Tax=Pasteurella multocida TaxID=747 RepID=UPI0029468B5F|nr:type I restriction endonuclease subunit R [Pasteurella multocida]MEE3749166.1 type I restriction endonuclease subunit R [Pasteurella multocida]HDR0999025.1 type I restriction endonuclease subunit R [Pasteurella multocida]HDR1015769.1 type I restriction endonuclease subunit R [Pasteurella multocida]HDR1017983.1 type I restriction endonuclease subunit R [Pasteurella multocida]
MIDENTLEQAALDWFRETGWQTFHAKELFTEGSNPQRHQLSAVILEPIFRTKFAQLNPHLPEDCVEQVLVKLKQAESRDLVEANQAFHRLLTQGVPVTYKKGDDICFETAFLLDYAEPERNAFWVVNQFEVRGSHLRRPDIICFINGLPIAILELKNPADEKTDVWDAFHQLQTYKNDLFDLLMFNGALAISDGVVAKVGSLTADEERFMPWRTVKNENDKPMVEWQLDTLIRGFFRPDLFTDYLRFFILFERNEKNRLIKKQASYHQFHAVREAVKATVIASRPSSDKVVQEPRANYGREVQVGSKKAGVVWHTQGSGKSISMCCYAGKLLQQPEMGNPTLLVVTDRNDLDGQLFQQFSLAKDLLKQDPVRAESREQLRELLASRDVGGVIFTTVQKFALQEDEQAHPLLNGRHNIVVISDEAHRSQYGLKAKLNAKGAFQFGYAKHMRDALQNATFIGFTGTPIETEDKDTRAVFGDYVSIYDIQDAVDDGATVPIYYESRLARLDINRSEIEELAQQFDEIVEEEEQTEAERIKGEFTRLEKLVGAQPRLQQIAKDLIQHFEKRQESQDGKAMIVAMSRDICVHLYNEIIALKPEWHNDDPNKGAIKIVMTGSAADKALLQPHIYSKQVKQDLEKRFKNPDDPLKLVIVRDMWLTGFDAPCCHTMYVDKPMRGHNLMQAIARVNRVFKDKPGGLVVDYIGIANELKQALHTYTNAKGRGKPTIDTQEALKVLLEKMDAIAGMFATPLEGKVLDIGQFETQAVSLLPKAANHILGLEDGKKRFADLVLAATKAYALCGTLEQSKTYQRKLAFYAAVKAMMFKEQIGDGKLRKQRQDHVLKQILDNSLIADGVDDIFTLCGLEKPNIGLLSDEFLEDVRQMEHKNLAVELLEKLLQDNIKSRSARNLVQERKYRERLEATLTKYHNRGIETAQVIEELIQMAKDFQEAFKRAEDLGLNSDEIAFYDALANNESAVRELGDKILKAIALELVKQLRSSVTVDWQVRESVRARLRILVRRILQKYKYPPDKADEAIELVLEQAETLSEQWCEKH